MATSSYSPKPSFSTTAFYGGTGGDAFDHGNRNRIVELAVRAGSVVDGITVKYPNGDVLTHGGEGGDAKSIFLADGEYINQVEVRAGKVVQCLTFTTNKGRKLGPCGGKGSLLAGGLAGEVSTVSAPSGCGLVAFKGRAGKYLDSIAFTWGPI